MKPSGVIGDAIPPDPRDGMRAIDPAAVRWQWSAFADFDVATLYTVLALRCAVFVVEQTCPYLDLDGRDETAWHLLGWHRDRLAAYARVFAPGDGAAEMAIGRVITAPFARGVGLGRPLMREALRGGVERFGAGPCRVGAQAHLEGFYRSLGFEPASGIYDEDGIPHLTMIRPAGR